VILGATEENMKAIAYTRYGGPDAMTVLELPEPRPAANQVLVKVAAVGLNPVDAMQRAGTLKMLHPYTFPKIAGNELSGVVTALGPGVSRFAVGDRVVSRVDKTALGALAQYLAIDEALVARAPKSVALVNAAALPLAGLTAQQALGPKHLDLQSGERLLVTGGAGGVGLLAIQLAKLAGAHVTTTASPEGRQVVEQAGADLVVNYRESKVSDYAEEFDKVLDLVGLEADLDVFTRVRAGGKVVSITGPLTPEGIPVEVSGLRRVLVRPVAAAMSRKARKAAAAAGATYDFFFMEPDAGGLALLCGLVDAGKLKLGIDSTYPLDDFASAFERLESRRAKGKIIIVMPS
jgi:alcohol dehydrogenase